MQTSVFRVKKEIKTKIDWVLSFEFEQIGKGPHQQGNIVRFNVNVKMQLALYIFSTKKTALLLSSVLLFLKKVFGVLALLWAVILSC